MRAKKSTLFLGMQIFFILMFSLVSSFPATAQEEDGPTVVWKSPEGNKVALDTNIIITFSERMLQDDTEQAFDITPETQGSFGWNDKNLTFTPSAPLIENQPYIVSISTNAKNLNGEGLKTKEIWSFTTEDKKEGSGKGSDNGLFNWEFWEPIVTGLTVIGTAIFALVGIWSLRRKRGKLRNHITRLDEIYEKYRKDPYVCEHKLNQLKESLKIKFKSGEMEENHYLIMDKKIDDYLSNVRYRKTLTKPKIIGGPEGEIREELEKQLIDMDPDEDISEKPPKSKKPPKPKIIPD
jgi:hypothetical protein